MFFQVRDGIGGLRCCNLHTSLHAPEKMMAAPWKRNIVLMIIWWTHCIRFFGDVKGLWVGIPALYAGHFFRAETSCRTWLSRRHRLRWHWIAWIGISTGPGGWVPGVEGDAYILLKVLLCKHAAKVNKKMVVHFMFMKKMGLMNGFMRFFMGGSSTKSQGSMIGKVNKVNTSRWVGWWLSCEP